MRVKYLKVKDAKRHGEDLGRFPNFSRTGSILGMKKLYYGKDALLVQSGPYIYNVTLEPYIYYNLAR